MKREDNYRNGRDRSASPGGRMNSRYVAEQEARASILTLVQWSAS
jgi:hypothetical protein